MTLAEIRTELERLLLESRSIMNVNGNPKALEETLDILHDYELQSEQIRKDCEHFHTETKPDMRNGVWLCPSCGRRVQHNNTHCHWCGKKLGWDGSSQKGGRGRCRR